MGIFSLFGSTTPRDRDEALLSQLKKAGSDLAKPHHIKFFWHFPSEIKAEMAAAGIRTEGFQTEVKRPLESADWLCYATKTMVPDLHALQNIRRTFEHITSLLEGHYDGWESSVEK